MNKNTLYIIGALVAGGGAFLYFRSKQSTIGAPPTGITGTTGSAQPGILGRIIGVMSPRVDNTNQPWATSVLATLQTPQAQSVVQSVGASISSLWSSLSSNSSTAGSDSTAGSVAPSDGGAVDSSGMLSSTDPMQSLGSFSFGGN